jgi:hypothetical protein
MVPKDVDVETEISVATKRKFLSYCILNLNTYLLLLFFDDLFFYYWQQSDARFLSDDAET